MSALGFIHYLRPVCERIEIAGSIRRNKPIVGDIEIVAIPKIFAPVERDLFGNVIGQPGDRIIETIEKMNTGPDRGPSPPWIERLNDGERYLKLRDTYLDIQIDLFLVRPPAEWGPILSIRTGPADFSRKLVTGLHVRKLKCKDGRVIDASGQTVPCPEEEQFFRLAGFRWKDPENRR